jgi:hypothetical protein
MTERSCRNCSENELEFTGVTHRHGSRSYHCTNCHTDQTYVQDPAGSSFWRTDDQYDSDDCPVCEAGFEQHEQR